MRPAYALRGPRGDLAALIGPELIEIVVTDHSGVEADRLSVRLDDRDGRLEIPRRGAELEVELGWADAPLAPVGRFVVDAVAVAAPPRTLTLGGRSADLTAGLKAPKSRDWRDLTVGAIVAAIADEHGLEARVAPALADVALPHLSQTAESDLHLLTRLAARMDAVAKVGAGRLIFARRGAALSVSGRPLAPVAVVAGDCASWAWALEDRGAWGSCAAFWQDAGGAERRRVATGDAAPQFEIGQVYASEEIALRAALARLAELRRGGLRLDLLLGAGRPEILAETPVDVSGLRDGVDGRWIAARVEHRLSADGLTTRLELSPPPEEAA